MHLQVCKNTNVCVCTKCHQWGSESGLFGSDYTAHDAQLQWYYVIWHVEDLGHTSYMYHIFAKALKVTLAWYRIEYWWLQRGLEQLTWHTEAGNVGAQRHGPTHAHIPAKKCRTMSHSWETFHDCCLVNGCNTTVVFSPLWAVSHSIAQYTRHTCFSSIYLQAEVRIIWKAISWNDAPFFKMRQAKYKVERLMETVLAVGGGRCGVWGKASSVFFALYHTIIFWISFIVPFLNV